MNKGTLTHALDYRISDGRIIARSIPSNIRTLCFPEKTYKGAEAIVEDTLDDDGTITSQVNVYAAPKYHVKGVNLATMLLTEWTTDVHFTQYYTPKLVRLKKEQQVTAPQEIEFRFIAFDLDFENHGRPTLENYRFLQSTLAIYDFTPNLMYATRGGARIIYYIDPIFDATVFELHYRAFLEHKTKGVLTLNNLPHGYKVDPQCKDWTRMFRAPKVVRDGQPTYDMPISEFRWMIGKRLSLETFQIKEKKVHQNFHGNYGFEVNDHVLGRWLREASEDNHNRNSILFKATCRILTRYDDKAIEKWLDLFHEKMLSEGLPITDIERTITSAIAHIGDNKETTDE